jgi:SRSO17 transposase
MSLPRAPKPTVGFVDQYCGAYQKVFPEVRSFEQFKLLHLGLLAELPRKTLPAIARVVGLEDEQPLHHFLANSPWEVTPLREKRLQVVKQVVGDRPLILCIDETGDKKKGKTTEYVARQYIGNLGKIENGIVAVHAYGIVDEITLPLLFQVFKPRNRLKEGDQYKSKPQIAIELIHHLQAMGFHFEVVLADSLYGESGDFIEALSALKLRFVVAIRENHGVLLPPGQRVRYTAWQEFDRVFSNGETETRWIREIIFGQRRDLRYYQLTTDYEEQPAESTWFLMTNVPGNVKQDLGNIYGMRTWIEYGFKQSKNELGWADFRLTAYQDIEKWWEIVSSAYLLVSLQAQPGEGTSPGAPQTEQASPVAEQPITPHEEPQERFQQHKWWAPGKGWKTTLNNLRLIIQPYVSYCLILPWLHVFVIPLFQEGFETLMAMMNKFKGVVPV